MVSPADVDLAHAIGLPPADAIAYFRSKGRTVSWSWRDMSEEAHAVAFTVAKSASYDVLGDLQDAVGRALAEGQTFREFASQDLVDTLRRKGWWGTVTGEGRERVRLGSMSRLRTIYRTNMKASMAAARYGAQWENREARPIWVYDAIEDSLTRPSHLALDGLAYYADDPIWRTLYPPNGYNCRCSVRAFTARDAEKRGIEVLSSEGRLTRVDQDFGGRQTHTHAITTPAGIQVTPDPGFGRRPMPGRAADQKLRRATRAAWRPATAEAIRAGTAEAARIAAIETKAAAPAPDAIRAAFAAMAAERMDAVRDLVAGRGPAVEIQTLRAAARREVLGVEVIRDSRPAAERLRRLSLLLPGDWVRRLNSGGPVEVQIQPNLTTRGRRARGLYLPAGADGQTEARIVVRTADDDVALMHELLHHVQQMHPEIDALLQAWAARNRIRFDEYANHRYRTARRSPAVGGMKDEALPVGLEWLAGGDGALALNRLIARDPEFWRLLVGILRGP